MSEEAPSQITSAEGLALVAEVRELCMALPEVTEAIDGFGHISFRINDKPLVILGEGDKGPSLSIKTDHWTQAHLLEADEAFYKTPYIGRHGWVSCRAGGDIDWPEVEAMVRATYRRIAPKRLVKQLDEG